MMSGRPPRSATLAIGVDRIPDARALGVHVRAHRPPPESKSAADVVPRVAQLRRVRRLLHVLRGADHVHVAADAELIRATHQRAALVHGIEPRVVDAAPGLILRSPMTVACVRQPLAGSDRAEQVQVVRRVYAARAFAGVDAS